MYTQQYHKSWALVIGINAYDAAPPLLYARNDAEVFAQTLVDRFGFSGDRIDLLLDDEATREGIMRAYLAHTGDDVGPDDRIVVFFAGHGHTRTGQRGDVGFLVPVDGDPDDIASLIRWDDLTRNAELIDAKHILFLMDACYGGLALTRAASPGTMRFVNDMLLRRSRQVLTAGKADETVADAGGPRADHSIFTGHLLDALDGDAYSPEGILTANRLMAHVYQKVSHDPYSQQTPHFGFLDGDGDLIFNPPPAADAGDPGQGAPDLLIPTQPDVEPPDVGAVEPTGAEAVKSYLADPASRIKLDDLVGGQVRAFLAETQGDRFSTERGEGDLAEQCSNRLRAYEEVTRPLQETMVLMGRWGDELHRPTLLNAFSRLPDGIARGGGITLWLGMRWYPIQLIMYSAGIASLAAERYENLAVALSAPVGASISGRGPSLLVVETTRGMLDVTRADAFKSLPGHERQYVPRSEYLFKVLQPPLEDLLYLGRGYEALFDRFEVFAALEYAHHRQHRRFWGPVGRFAYKYTGAVDQADPFSELVREAERAGESWRPLRAGLFGGSLDRFMQLVEGCKGFMGELGWY